VFVPDTVTVTPARGAFSSPAVTLPEMFLSCAWPEKHNSSNPMLRSAKERNFLINKRFKL
jgi:hypothetical protein